MLRLFRFWPNSAGDVLQICCANPSPASGVNGKQRGEAGSGASAVDIATHLRYSNPKKTYPTRAIERSYGKITIKVIGK